MPQGEKPTADHEKRLARQGYRLIAGVDEVGRGALAGPVMAGAVILPANLKARWLAKVRDSKLLTPEERTELSPQIMKAAVAFGFGLIPNQMIDTIGIAPASRLAMKQAIGQLRPQPDFVLVDYFHLPEVSIPHQGLEDGDTLCLSIACASVIAKVARDGLLCDLDALYPGYGLAQHKGYYTSEHRECLRRLGPSPIHRRSFAPVGDWNHDEA